MAVKYERTALVFRVSPTPGPASPESAFRPYLLYFPQAQRPQRTVAQASGRQGLRPRVFAGKTVPYTAQTWAQWRMGGTWNLDVTKLMCYEHMCKVNRVRALRVEREVSMVHGAMEVRP